jgi:hypothetical protein
LGANTAIAPRLAELEAETETLLRRIEEAETKGIPLDRQRIAWRTAADFAGYCREDLENGFADRASKMAEEIAILLGDAHGQLDRIALGEIFTPEVPRYRTSRITVDGLLRAKIRWPRGREESAPVIFTGYGHFNQVRRDLPKFRDYGINIIQIEIGPSSTILPSGQINREGLESLLPAFSLAEQHDVAVNLLTSPHYFPKWATDRHPDLAVCEGGFIKFCIDAPEARAIIERHLVAVTELVGDHPALHSMCLSNEPVYRSCANDVHTRRLWSDYLRERFRGDLGMAGEILGHRSRDFESFPIPDHGRVEPTPLFYEWCLFNQLRFAAWHGWMADVIHRIAPRVPVHAKIMPTCIFRKNIADGVDPRLFCSLSQINGNDCWCMYQHGEGEYSQEWLSQSFFYDLLRSSRDGPIFNSENHIIKDRERKAIPWQHVRSALWQGAIHGQCATTIWVWERTYDEQSDFAGSIMHRPLCARAAGETGLDLIRLSREVAALQGVRPGVGILYSNASIVYDETYLPEAKRVYEALNFTGRRISFVWAEKIAEERCPPFLIVPSARHLELETFRALEGFSREGGQVILFGKECCTRDEHDRPIDGKLEPAAGFPSLPSTRGIRDVLLPILGDVGIAPLDHKAKLPWGIEWMDTHLDGRWILNAVNLLRDPQTVSWFAGGHPLALINLFTGQDHTGPMTMAPMDPLLAEVRDA